MGFKLEIVKWENLSDKHYELLLMADPNLELVTEYVKRGKCFDISNDEQLIGVMVLLYTRPETLEIVNIAVASAFQDKGYGKSMLEFAKEYAKDHKVRTLEIGTGSTSYKQLALYQKAGFRMQAIDRDFFTRHYQEPIVENGLVLQDMVRLAQDVD
jgi:ribosomal protein S18 acetylase RimI-like enzyme